MDWNGMEWNACVFAKLNFVGLQKNHCLQRALNSAKPASLSWLENTLHEKMGYSISD